MKLLSLLALATAAASAFAASQPDLNAFYQFGWAGRADNDQGRQITSVQLVQVNNTEVDVYGLFHELSARAIYDADEMSLTFLQQQLLPADEWNGKALWLYTEVFELSNGELKNEHAVPYIKFYYQPTGVKMDEGLREFVGGGFPSPTTISLKSTTRAPLSPDAVTTKAGSMHYISAILTRRGLRPAISASMSRNGCR